MAEDNGELRERIGKLETEFKHVVRDLDEISVKLTALHELFLQARGFKWAVVLLAAVAGFALNKIGMVIGLIK